MKNANKRLLISLAALVIAIALAATTTFAWFTMDTTPRVTDINLTVTAQDGLYISSDGAAGTFRTAITMGEEEIDVALQAITPNGAGTFKKIVDGTRGEETAAIAGDYYTHTFTIRSQSEYEIYLNSLTITSQKNADRGTIEAWRTFTSEQTGASEIAKGAALPEARLANAIRIGFVVGGTFYTYKQDPTGGFSAFTINPNIDHFVTMYENEWAEGEQATFESAWSTPGGTAGVLGAASGTKLATLTKVSDATFMNNWYATTVTVYIWAEGTDKDCFNEVLLDSASISFEFAGKYIAPETED